GVLDAVAEVADASLVVRRPPEEAVELGDDPVERLVGGDAVDHEVPLAVEVLPLLYGRRRLGPRLHGSTIPSPQMGIGEQFAWCHMQKTGGDATLQMFELFPRLIVRADARNVEAKHTTFAEREPDVRGKLLACNIRRLPAWMLSWDQHFSQHRA